MIQVGKKKSQDLSVFIKADPHLDHDDKGAFLIALKKHPPVSDGSSWRFGEMVSGRPRPYLRQDQNLNRFIWDQLRERVRRVALLGVCTKSYSCLSATLNR